MFGKLLVNISKQKTDLRTFSTQFCKTGTLTCLARNSGAASLQWRSLAFYPIDDKISGLTDDQVALRKSIFDFCQKEISPLAER